MGCFKAYDVRGRFGVDFDLDTVYRIGRALPAVVGGRRWLVGRDGRASSPAVAGAVAAGLRAAGMEVTDLGEATTPMVYFFTAEDGYDGSVMVTASHNPPEDNGLKISRRGAVPVGYETGLADVERLVAADPSVCPAEVCPQAAGEVCPPTAEVCPRGEVARYAAWLEAHAPCDLRGLRVAVDCSDGMAALAARRLFPGAVFLNDTVDGTFPHHAPNPLLPEARAELARTVRERGLDCGVIFDGDADRCVFVDENGELIAPDTLIPLLAETFGEPGATVIHDVRTSRAVIERLRADGFTPVMGKVGHAYAKVLLRETGAVCGGELAGHYYFRDFHGCDSGLFAARRILDVFARARAGGRTVSAVMAPVARRYFNSGEMNFRVADARAALADFLSRAAALAPEVSRTTIDGVRLEFADGWVSVRASNTEPLVRVIVEAGTRARLDAWTARLTGARAG